MYKTVLLTTSWAGNLPSILAGVDGKIGLG
jgi:hypothetical protein